MAVCKSPQHIFENQFPENQTLLESVMSTWSQNVVNPVNQTQGSSFSESESLQLCTEGLGSESSDDVEENFQVEMIKEEKMVSASVKHVASGTSSGELRRSRTSRQDFPPPLSFIGKSAKTGVRFTSYRQDGRFVLKEIRIPIQEFLQARREDGRLKLQIVQPSDYIVEEDDEEFEEHDADEAENEKIEEEN
ncbi:hypothetical protein Csa_003279 [Cucumis sativus]|nr:hypothetical protein Csa_003279 [Cucumis sativus]